MRILPKELRQSLCGAAIVKKLFIRVRRNGIKSTAYTKGLMLMRMPTSTYRLVTKWI